MSGKGLRQCSGTDEVFLRIVIRTKFVLCCYIPEIFAENLDFSHKI